jgi:hypothetical protein
MGSLNVLRNHERLAMHTAQQAVSLFVANYMLGLWIEL